MEAGITFSVPISNAIMVVSQGKSILTGLTAIQAIEQMQSLSEEEIEGEASCHGNYLEQAQSLMDKVQFPTGLRDEISECYLDARTGSYSDEPVQGRDCNDDAPIEGNRIKG